MLLRCPECDHPQWWHGAKGCNTPYGRCACQVPYGDSELLTARLSNQSEDSKDG